MSLLSENVIPGNHGKVFGTDAKEHHSIEQIKKAILSVEGVENVLFDEEKFPREFTVQTSKIVEVKVIEEAVRATGFHAIPNKHIFPL